MGSSGGSANGNGSTSLCPRCGGADIAVTQEKVRFDTKKAIIGGVLTGGIGAVAGFMGGTTEKYQCQGCGFTWKGSEPGRSIKQKELVEIQEPVCYMGKGSENVTFEAIVDRFMEKAKEYGIVIQCMMGQVEIGNAFNRATLPCVVVYHPEHPNDYKKLCIERNAFGANGCKISVFAFGSSPLLDAAGESVFDGPGLLGALTGRLWGGSSGQTITAASIGWSIGHGAVVAAKKGFNALRSSPMELETEKNWLQVLLYIAHEVIV